MNEQKNDSRGRFLVVGFCLWGAVFAALFFMWKQRTAESARIGVEDSAGTNVVAIEGNGSSDVPDEVEAGGREPDEIKFTWPERGVRDFTLTDSRGEKVSKSDLLGKPWIASFIFTRCAGPCPRVAAAFKELQKRYPEHNVNLVTFTVDPDNDTPEVLTKFANFWEADLDRWLFLTGDKDTIYNMIGQDFLMPVGPSPDPTPGWEIIHTTNICLVDQTGKVVGKYNSLKEAEVSLLRRDLDALLGK